MGRRCKYPSYREHKPSGRAVVTLNGKDVYLGAYGRQAALEEYDRVISEWLANGRRLPEEREERALTLSEVLAQYWRFAKVEYVRDGRKTPEYYHLKTVIRIMRRLYGGTLAQEFGPLALKACREQLVKAGQARRTVNQNVSRMKRIIRWAAEHEAIPASVWQGVQSVAGLRRGRSSAKEGRRVAPVPEKHVKAVLRHVSAAVAAMIQVQELTGMRPGEVCSMRVEEVDRSQEAWRYRPAGHKTAYLGHERVVFFGPKAQKVLEPFVAGGKTGYVFSPQEAEEARSARRRLARKSRMTPSQAKRKRKANRKRAWRDHYDPNTYRRAIQRACVKAKVPKWGPHQLRHNAATRIREEYGIDVAQAVLGHRSPAVTAIYAEISQSKAAEAMQKVG